MECRTTRGSGWVIETMHSTIMLSIKNLLTPRRGTQLLVILLCALGLKLYYSTASPNDLRWILAPTTVLVEFITGRQFEFESHAGYLSSDRTYLIAASCAGVNFLITAFLMLSLRKLWVSRGVSPKAPLPTREIEDSRGVPLWTPLDSKMHPTKDEERGAHGGTPLQKWTFIPAAAVFAYLATLIANTVRISIALWMQQTSFDVSWLSANQLHRFEGIFVYFGFLLILFIISEKVSAQHSKSWLQLSVSEWLRLSAFPLLIYYAIMLGIPMANGAYRKGTDFWEHSLYVLLIPLPLVLLVTLARRLANSSICNAREGQFFAPTARKMVARGRVLSEAKHDAPG
ncbi:MAG TPA: exosortase K [Pyrinomonadaceae bacterium]|nr:exosortase K [Pyrinomonadaceae bacterium]